MKTITVPGGKSVRLDLVVSASGLVGSRRKAQQAIGSGKVSVAGRVCGPEDVGLKVAPGTEVVVDLSRPGTAPAKVRAKAGLAVAGISVIYEDARLVVVDKPSGLLTDTATVKQARERDSARKRVRAYLRAHGQDAIVVHRIDRDTSGVVLFAKDEAAAEHLRRQFRSHGPERVYHLVVHGVVAADDAEWVDVMAWDAGRRVQRVVPEAHPDAFRASCRAVVAARHHASTRLEVSLVTGRRNQIRLQAMLRGHPLVGERLYVPEGWKAPRTPRMARQALHARRLTVMHPDNGRPVTFEAPWPPDFAHLVAATETL